MIYLIHILKNSLPIFITVLPFEQKEAARNAGFVWNRLQAGAWATDNLSVALTFVRSLVHSVKIRPDTLDYLKANSKMTDETYQALRARWTEPDKKTQAGILAATMSDEQAAAAHTIVKLLASVCDGSLREDMAGFNRNDTEFGHNMADLPKLSRNQAAYVLQMCAKYQGQIPAELYAVAYPERVRAQEDAADLKASQKAEKAHAKGKACGWTKCQLCTQLPGQPQTPAPAIQLPASSLENVAAGAAKTIGNMAASMYTALKNQPVDVVIDEDIIQANMMITAEKAREIATRELAPLTEVKQQPVGYYDADKKEIIVTKSNQIVSINVTEGADDPQKAEIINLVNSLIDCSAADFDITVELLRNLRGFDQKKKAGSQFIEASWQAAGYKTV